MEFTRKVTGYCKSPYANICAQWATTPALQVFARPVVCVVCNHLSKSHQAHSVHMFRAHGVKSDMRRYVPSTHCLVCLREFGERETCLNHVRYRSKVCHNNLLLRGPVLSVEEACVLDDACKARNRQLHAAGRTFKAHYCLFCFRLAAQVPIILWALVTAIPNKVFLVFFFFCVANSFANFCLCAWP